MRATETRTGIRSRGAVEQLLGRVLRMPFATRRSSEELNRAYAHVSEKNFFDAAEGLRDRLVDIGFDEQTALSRDRRTTSRVRLQ